MIKENTIFDNILREAAPGSELPDMGQPLKSFDHIMQILKDADLDPKVVGEYREFQVRVTSPVDGKKGAFLIKNEFGQWGCQYVPGKGERGIGAGYDRQLEKRVIGTFLYGKKKADEDWYGKNWDNLSAFAASKPVSHYNN